MRPCATPRIAVDRPRATSAKSSSRSRQRISPPSHQRARIFRRFDKPCSRLWVRRRAAPAILARCGVLRGVRLAICAPLALQRHRRRRRRGGRGGGRSRGCYGDRGGCSHQRRWFLAIHHSLRAQSFIRHSLIRQSLIRRFANH